MLLFFREEKKSGDGEEGEKRISKEVTRLLNLNLLQEKSFEIKERIFYIQVRGAGSYFDVKTCPEGSLFPASSSSFIFPFSFFGGGQFHERKAQKNSKMCSNHSHN